MFEDEHSSRAFWQHNRDESNTPTYEDHVQLRTTQPPHSAQKSSSATTQLSPNTGQLLRSSSLQAIHAQSSTETSGLGETIPSGLSSQESLHSQQNSPVQNWPDPGQSMHERGNSDCALPRKADGINTYDGRWTSGSDGNTDYDDLQSSADRRLDHNGLPTHSADSNTAHDGLPTHSAKRSRYHDGFPARSPESSNCYDGLPMRNTEGSNRRDGKRYEEYQVMPRSGDIKHDSQERRIGRADRIDHTNATSKHSGPDTPSTSATSQSTSLSIKSTIPIEYKGNASRQWQTDSYITLHDAPASNVAAGSARAMASHGNNVFDELFDKSNGSQAGSNPSPPSQRNTMRWVSVSHKHPHNHSAAEEGTGLYPEQVEQEGERRRSSLLSIHLPQSPRAASDCCSRNSSYRSSNKFLGTKTESRWMRWCNNRRASHQRRLEILEKNEKERESARVSTPVQKARREGMKFVHPDLEHKYLSEDDIKATQHQQYQQYYYHGIMDKRGPGAGGVQMDTHALSAFWERSMFSRSRCVGIVFNAVAVFMAILSVILPQWIILSTDSGEDVSYEGMWVNCSYSDSNSTGVCSNIYSDHWQNAVIGFLIFSASFGFLASVLSVLGLCTSQLPRKIYYYHSAGEIFFVCAVTSTIALIIYPIAVEIDLTISFHRYGIGYGLGWGSAFFFYAAALCMSLDELIRTVQSAKCWKKCVKRLKNGTSGDLQQV